MNIKYIVFIFLLFLNPSKGFCTNWSGRFTLGSYASTERFKDITETGSDKNDFQTLSTRLFIKGEEFGNNKDWEVVTDLRDKHDFFDKLNSEKLTLEDRNQFQLRQLSIRLSNPKKFWGFQMGRFPIYEAGSTFVDGLSLENHWTENLYSTYFGGLNPQKRGRSYLEHDSKAKIQGMSLTYQNHNGGWDRNLFISHGVVEESYEQHKDRNFVFQNMIYQWNTDSRLMSLLYYDLIPRSYVQNGNLTWQQGWTPSFLSDLSFSAMDVIEYSRNKEVLEILPSSPYEEKKIKFTYRTRNRNIRIYYMESIGERKLDQLTRRTSELGYIQSQIWGPQWDAYVVFGARKNFTSDDTLTRLGLGRYGRKWEFNFDFELQKQVNQNGTITNPVLTELDLSYNISRQSFCVFSAQSASNENVKILSGFFKYGHRFGSNEVPPLRDGAPPRGPL